MAEHGRGTPEGPLNGKPERLRRARQWIIEATKQVVGPGLPFWMLAIVLWLLGLGISGLETTYRSQIGQLSQPWDFLLSTAFGSKSFIWYAALAMAVAGLSIPILKVSMSGTAISIAGSLERGLDSIGEKVRESLLGSDERDRINVISHLIDTSRLTRDHYKDLARRCHRRQLNNPDDKDWEYFEFVHHRFIDLIYGVTPVFREDYFASVRLNEPTGGGMEPKEWKSVAERGYLRWERDMRYYIRSMQEKFDDTIKMQTSNVIDPDFLPVVLRHTEFGLIIKAGGEGGRHLLSWNIKSVLPEERADDLAKKLLEENRITGKEMCGVYEVQYEISYDQAESGGPILDLSIAVPVSLGKEPLWVEGYERQFLRRDENFYHINIHHPTKGIHVQMSLLKGLEAWSLLEPTLAPQKYPKEESGPIFNDGDSKPPSPHFRNVQLRDWVLPGIALTMEWQYPFSDRIFGGKLGPKMGD